MNFSPFWVSKNWQFSDLRSCKSQRTCLFLISKSSNFKSFLNRSSREMPFLKHFKKRCITVYHCIWLQKTWIFAFLVSKKNKNSQISDLHLCKSQKNCSFLISKISKFCQIEQFEHLIKLQSLKNLRKSRCWNLVILKNMWTKHRFWSFSKVVLNRCYIDHWSMSKSL